MNPLPEDQIESNSLFDNADTTASSSGAERLSVPLPQHQSSTVGLMMEEGHRKNDEDEHDDGVDSKQVSKKMTPLPPDFQPSENDVILARGRHTWNSVGNVRFRQIVESRVDDYSAAKTKLDKSVVLSSIVTEIRRLSPNGGFVKKDPKTKKWFEVGDFLAREKVSQSFRDVLHDKYRSSNKMKKKRRLEEQAKSAEINSTMQEIALEQIQSGKTDKNLYEIICQQQSLLDSGKHPQHIGEMREDQAGGGLVSKPDTRLSDLNATAAFPPSNVGPSLPSMHHFQNQFGTLTHPAVAGGNLNQTNTNPMGFDFSAPMHRQPPPQNLPNFDIQPQNLPSFDIPQPFSNTVNALLGDASLARQPHQGIPQMPMSMSMQMSTQMPMSMQMPTMPQHAFQAMWNPQYQHQPQLGAAAFQVPTVAQTPQAIQLSQTQPRPAQLSEAAQSLEAAIRQSSQGEIEDVPDDNPFEPVPLPEDNQCIPGSQPFPDDIDNIFDS